jgi:hypothetical protein
MWMLVDTGSTVSVLPPGVSEDLGLELGAWPHPVKGLGGSVTVQAGRAYAQLVKADTSGRQGEPLLLDPLMVVADEQILPIPILGRRPFLEYFELTLREHQKELVLRA